jgi:hypothetical protein
MDKETKLVLIDTQTGEKVSIKSKEDAFYWAEGNGSCDCNRELLFGKDTNNGHCLGSKRYLIIESDYENYTLDELNEDYPKI